jgi:hypothetical protein
VREIRRNDPPCCPDQALLLRRAQEDLDVMLHVLSELIGYYPCLSTCHLAEESCSYSSLCDYSGLHPSHRVFVLASTSCRCLRGITLALGGSQGIRCFYIQCYTGCDKICNSELVFFLITIHFGFIYSFPVAEFDPWQFT